MVVAGAACASGMRRDAPVPTLEVHNEGPAAVDLRLLQGVTVAGDTLGYFLGTVFAGRVDCFALQEISTPQWLSIHSIDGTLRTPSFLAASRTAWVLELTGNPRTDPLGLSPVDVRCKPGTSRRSN